LFLNYNADNRVENNNKNLNKKYRCLKISLYMEASIVKHQSVIMSMRKTRSFI